MKIRKDMIFAVVTTFCLSALMFAVIPIRSGLPTYDPWADTNDDNKIDMKDIGNVAFLFGLSNTDNLTRNVNVTNWPEDRPTIVMKQTQRIPIMESTADGVYIPYGNEVFGAKFVFNFEPVGQLINVTEFYVSTIWKCPDNNNYGLEYRVNWYYDYLDAVDTSANPRAWWNNFHLSEGYEIHEGVNNVNIWRPFGASTGNVILYKFELLVVYFSAV
jgi:hypothetical protein